MPRRRWLWAWIPQTDDVMGRKPRKVTDRVIDASMWGDIIYIGVIMAIVTLIGMDMHLSGGLFTDRSVDAIGHEAQMTEARTMGFTILVFAQLFNCAGLPFASAVLHSWVCSPTSGYGVRLVCPWRCSSW